MGAVAESADLHWPPLPDGEVVVAEDFIGSRWVLVVDFVAFGLAAGVDDDSAHDTVDAVDGMGGVGTADDGEIDAVGSSDSTGGVCSGGGGGGRRLISYCGSGVVVDSCISVVLKIVICAPILECVLSVSCGCYGDAILWELPDAGRAIAALRMVSHDYFK